MTTLLMPEKPIAILPGLAVAVGLNEAIFLQQLHYWLNGSEVGKKYGRNKDGHTWIYNDYEGWKTQSFPFWSVSTIRRIAASLEKNNLIIAEIEMSSDFPGGRRKWYRINYDATSKLGYAQNEHTGMSNLNIPSVQNEQSYNIDTETTTETISNDMATPVVAAAKKKPRKNDKPSFPAADINPVKDRIVELFGWSWDTMTPEESGQVQRAAYSWMCGKGTIEQLKPVYDYCSRTFDHFGPTALSSSKSKVIKVKQDAASGPATPTPDQLAMREALRAASNGR